MMESRLNPGRRTCSRYSCWRVCTSIVLSLAGILLKKARPLVGRPSSQEKDDIADVAKGIRRVGGIAKASVQMIATAVFYF